MTPGGVVLAALDQLVSPIWPGLARSVWCRRQRLLLGEPGRGVVWVRPDAVPWAEWGAQRGYFELGRMDGLPYLSGAAAR